MQYQEFVGKVQNQARLGTEGAAVRAMKATLQTLATRLHGGEAKELAAQLPEGIGHFLAEHDEPSESFNLDEFYQRVQENEGVDLPDAVFHARVVMQVLEEAASGGEMKDVKAQLPPEFEDLFEPVG